MKFLLPVFFLLSALSAKAADYSKEFTPSPGIRALLSISGDELNWKLDSAGSTQGHIVFDTGNALNVSVYDDKSNGRLGFAVWHMDDGMGRYTISRTLTLSSLKTSP